MLRFFFKANSLAAKGGENKKPFICATFEIKGMQTFKEEFPNP